MEYKGKCVTLIGTASIQDYIFGSNDLKENLGASEAVYQALEQCRELPATQEDVIYVGGGNAALIFPDRPTAEEAIKIWSRAMLEKYPGLRAVVAHVCVTNSLREAYERATKQLPINENKPPFGSRFGAMPAVRNCVSTGLAASRQQKGWRSREGGPDGPPLWLSAEAIAKRNMVPIALKRWNTRLPRCPLRLEDLGIEEGKSQIAVVHADGNGIGKLFLDIVRDELLDDDTFKNTIRKLSEDVTDIANSAFEDTVDAAGGDTPPLRPIVWGGDDLTFVCDGRMGLSLATKYLENFEKHAGDKRLNGCVGVAIVPLKFPFSRAYHLAEDLCNNAKAERHKNLSKGGWIDFQLVLEGAAENLHATREVLYGGDHEKLLQRPLMVPGSKNDPRSWKFFEDSWCHFDENWPRNRAKRLWQTIPKGKSALTEMMAAFRTRGYDTPYDPVKYFDVLEMLDFHEPVWRKAKTQKGGQ